MVSSFFFLFKTFRALTCDLLFISLCYFHHGQVHLVSDTLLCILTPLNAIQCIIVNCKAAFFTLYFRICRKKFNLCSAIRAYFFTNCRSTRLSLTSIHYHSSTNSFKLIKQNIQPCKNFSRLKLLKSGIKLSSAVPSSCIKAFVMPSDNA